MASPKVCKCASGLTKSIWQRCGAAEPAEFLKIDIVLQSKQTLDRRNPKSAVSLPGTHNVMADAFALTILWKR